MQKIQTEFIQEIQTGSIQEIQPDLRLDQQKKNATKKAAIGRSHH